MHRTSSTSAALAALLATSISIAVAPPAAAQADCTQWDVGTSWVAVQGSFRITFDLRQNGSNIQGSGTVTGGPRGTDSVLGIPSTNFGGTTRGGVSGALNGNTLELNTEWGGVYLGTIDATGRIDGTTYDKNNSNSNAKWYSDRRMNCLARASDAPPPPRASSVFCQNYANQAAVAAGEYHNLKCGSGGARWSTNMAFHLDWCNGLGGNQALPNQETAARRSGLDACKRSKLKEPSRAGDFKKKATKQPTTPGPAGDFKKKATAPVPAATCIPGYVWRVARADDLVCVTPGSRARVAQENRTAASRIQPGGGAYGPNTCKSGFVWREAFAGDLVCVTPEVRTLVREENRVGPSRRVQ